MVSGLSPFLAMYEYIQFRTYQLLLTLIKSLPYYSIKLFY